MAKLYLKDNGKESYCKNFDHENRNAPRCCDIIIEDGAVYSFYSRFSQYCQSCTLEFLKSKGWSRPDGLPRLYIDEKAAVVKHNPLVDYYMKYHVDYETAKRIKSEARKALAQEIKDKRAALRDKNDIQNEEATKAEIARSLKQERTVTEQAPTVTEQAPTETDLVQENELLRIQVAELLAAVEKLTPKTTIGVKESKPRA